MFTYAYRCTQVGLKSIKKKKEEKKKIKRPTGFETGYFFEALYLIKIQTHTVFPNSTELLTFAYKK